jgi:hypothetical protein
MESRIASLKFVLALCLLAPAVSAHAASVSVDCSKKSLSGELAKLNKLAANEVQISGNCLEDIAIDGHLNLTLVGTPGASISATAPNTTALGVLKSLVTVKTLTLNGGSNGAYCESRSTCVFHDVTVQGGSNGISAQDQSAIYIIGASSIVDTNQGTGVGVYGASSVNIRPTWANGFNATEAGPVVSGHAYGLFVQDGSFLRTDSVTISDNVTGVYAQRNATVKIYGNASGAVVGGNSELGVFMNSASVGDININFTDNGLSQVWGSAIAVGPLSYVSVRGGTFTNNQSNSSCWHATGVLQGNGVVPNCNN